MASHSRSLELVTSSSAALYSKIPLTVINTLSLACDQTYVAPIGCNVAKKISDEDMVTHSLLSISNDLHALRNALQTAIAK